MLKLHSFKKQQDENLSGRMKRQGEEAREYAWLLIAWINIHTLYALSWIIQTSKVEQRKR